MAHFKYKAINPNGKEISGIIEAADTQEAITKVKEKGYYPIKFTEAEAPGDADSTSDVSHKKKKQAGEKLSLNKDIKIPFLGIGTVKLQEIAVFTRQLATLIDAGLPLVRSLNILHDQLKSGPLRDIIGDLSKEVSSGGTLSDALARYPRVFTPLYVNMMKAGEAGGILEIILERLADFNEKNIALIRKIKSALAYPSIVVIFAIAMLAGLVFFIIPKFMGIFETMGMENLPVLTSLIMKFASASEKYWVIGLFGAALLFISFKLLCRFKKVKFFLDKTKLHLPVMGELLKKIEVTRFSRTLGTLISSGVPILQALRITKGTMGNELIVKSIGQVHDSIREGESIAGPLKSSGVFPAMVVNMIDVGEETGSLDSMLIKVADIYDDEVDTTVNTLTSILEPFLIIGMGIIVAIIVIAMFLPLIHLMTNIGLQT